VSAQRPCDGVGFHVIVPAVMGVGLLLSLVTLVRDEAGRLRSHAARDRRVQAHAHAAALAALAGTDAARRDVTALRGRAPTAAAAGVLLVFALYLVPGATWNFFNPVNRMRDLAWLWGVSLSVVVVAGAAGLVLAAAALHWDDLPAAARPLALRMPVTSAPAPRAGADAQLQRPAVRRLALTSLAALVAFTTLSLFVASGEPLAVDEPLVRTTTAVEGLRHLRWLNPLAETETAFAVSALIGVATWRCRTFAMTYVVSIAAAWVLALGTNRLVDRPRPDQLPHDIASYPSGHVTVAALMTGLLPLAVVVLSHRAQLARLVAGVLGVGLLGVVVERASSSAHWPLDLLASLLVGVVVTAAAYAVVLDPSRHRSCHGCPWQRPQHRRARGAGGDGGQP
jgi:undecaprenyl-diphosphatase